MIDDIRIRPAAVVQARERNPQILLLLNYIEDSPRRQRPLVDAVERADGSGVNRKVCPQNNIIGLNRSQCKE